MKKLLILSLILLAVFLVKTNVNAGDDWNNNYCDYTGECEEIIYYCEEYLPYCDEEENWGEEECERLEEVCDEYYNYCSELIEECSEPTPTPTPTPEVTPTPTPEVTPTPEPTEEPKRDEPKENTFSEDTRCNDSTPLVPTWLAITDGSEANNWHPQATWSAEGGDKVQFIFGAIGEGFPYTFTEPNDGHESLGYMDNTGILGQVDYCYKMKTINGCTEGEYSEIVCAYN